MSGTEIVAIIERETCGKWKPSPGSIYPLLAWLQDKDYTNESFSVEDGMKRYALTNKGKQFFEDQVKFGQNFLEKLEWLAPMLVEGFHFGTNHENLLCARESAKRLLKTFMEIQAKQDNLSKHDVQEIALVLDDSNRQLKEIAQRIKEEKPA
jgi:DNA-binding PadR family transcriptional regulator